MDSRTLVSNVHPVLSIPDLIELIRHTFRSCKYDEVQNILMEREKRMKLEIEEHVRDRDSLKKEIELLEKSQRCVESQKLAVEEKLEMSKRKCDDSDKVIVLMKEEISALKNEKLLGEENLKCSNRKREELALRLYKMVAELKRCEDFENEKMVVEEKLKMSKSICDESDKKIAQMEEEIRALKNEKVVVEENLNFSNSKCEELDGRLLEKLKRCEDLEKEKSVVEEKYQSIDRKCEEMLREIEELRHEKLDVNVTIAELKQKEMEANQTVQELKFKNGEASHTIDELRSKVADLDKSILRIESGLSKMLSVDTKDLPTLVNGMDADVLPEVRAACDNSAGSVGVGLSQKGGITMAHPRTVPVVAERVGTVKDGEGQEPGVKGPTGKTQPAGVVIVLSDSDDEEDAVGTIPEISRPTSKRNRTECKEDSPIPSTAKRKSTFAQPSRCNLLSSKREVRATVADSEYPTLSTFTVNYQDCVDSDTETCSDTHMINYVATSFQK